MNIKNEKFGDIYYDGDFLNNAIAILKLKKVELEIYGELRPFVIHNKDNELAVIMPIKNKFIQQKTLGFSKSLIFIWDCCHSRLQLFS